MNNRHATITWKTFPEVERFGGEDGSGFEGWVAHFDLLCHCNNCFSEDDKTDALLLALKDDAAHFIMGLPDFRRMTHGYLSSSLRQ